MSWLKGDGVEEVGTELSVVDLPGVEFGRAEFAKVECAGVVLVGFE